MASARPGTKHKPQHARDVLSYEIWMLRKTQEQLGVWNASGFKRASEENHALYCAVLESFLVHARSLLWFFYRPAKIADDIVAGQFFGRGSAWKPPVEPPWIETKWLRPMNKLLQHMTSSRMFPAPVWDEEEIRKHIDKLIEEFNRCGPSGGLVPAKHPGRT